MDVFRQAQTVAAGKETLDEIRARKGNQKIEKEEQEKDKQKDPLKITI
jgi:hypothetical protein